MGLVLPEEETRELLPPCLPWGDSTRLQPSASQESSHGNRLGGPLISLARPPEL